MGTTIPDRPGDKLQVLIIGEGKFPIVQVPRGFHDITGKMGLPLTGDMFVMVTSVDRHYEITTEGDLELVRPQHTQPNVHLPDIFLVALRWSDAAKAAGNGSGVLVVKDVSILEKPSRFSVTAGEAAVSIGK